LDALDYKKAVILFSLYCVAAPLFGLLIGRWRIAQKAVFLLLCFLTMGGFLHAQEWGLTITSQLYRGHSRGFHFFWAEVAAIVLIFGSMAGQWKSFRFFPPGFFLWILYCFGSLISLFNAPEPMYGWYAFAKALKMIVVFVAAYNFIKTEDDLRFALLCFAGVIGWELFAVLRQKYVERIYQVWGTFEHQNSLCMYTILIGMVFLAVALGPKHKRSNFYLFAFLACAAIVQSSLSRAGLLIFAAGSLAVVVASLIDRPTRRRIKVLGGLACVGIIGLTLTIDTIMLRFNQYGNEESKRTRDMLNVSSKLMLQDYPAGIGWNNFAVTINAPFTYGEHIDDWQRKNNNPVDKRYKKGVVESLWWLLLAETGYQGLILFLLFVGLFYWMGIQNAIFFRRSYIGAVSVGILIGTSMNYLQSFLERVLTQPRNMMLWFILLAATARITAWRKAELRRRRMVFLDQFKQPVPQKLLEYHEPAPALRGG
jgi:hypothetical protein